MSVETVVATTTPEVKTVETPAAGEKSLTTIMQEASLEAGLDPDTEIAISDDGEISFVNPKKEAEANAKKTEDEGKGKVLDAKEDPAYKELQGAFTKATQENATLKDSITQLLLSQTQLTNRLSALEKGQTPATDETEEVDLDTLLQDKTALKSFLQSEITKGVQAGLKKELGEDYGEMNERQRVGLDLQRTIEKYPDFKEYGSELQVLVDEFPNASFEQLYLASKKLRGSKPNSGGSATSESKPAVTTTEDPVAKAEALKAKAAALGTESGVSGKVPDSKPINSIRDAIGETFRELGL